MNLVFLLAVCANSLVDSFPFKYMRIGKLILNHLIGNTCRVPNGLLDSYFSKLTLGTDYLKLCIWRAAFKAILTQQYYKNVSYFQTRALSGDWYVVVFKSNLYKLYFEPSYRMFIIND